MTSAMTRCGDWSISATGWDQSWAVWSQSLVSAKDWSKKWNDPVSPYVTSYLWEKSATICQPHESRVNNNMMISACSVWQSQPRHVACLDRLVICRQQLIQSPSVGYVMHCPELPRCFFLHLLTFNDDPDPRVDSESPFHFIRHCAIGDFWTFVSIFHTINGRFVPYLAKWLTPKRLHPQHFGTDLTDIRIRINPKIWIQITSVILSFCKDDNWRTRKRSSTKHGRFSAFC